MQSVDRLGLGRAVGEASPIPMVELESSAHIVRYVNPAFCLLTGKSEEDLLGSDFSEIADLGKELPVLLKRGHRTGHAESRSGQKDSNSLIWSYTMWPVLAADDSMRGVIIQVTETTSFHQDATAMNQALLLGSVRQHELTEAAEHLASQLQSEILARQQAEQALIRSEKLASVGRMAAVLAHEINNPLAAVMGILYLIRNTGSLSLPVADYLEKADGELKRIAYITRQTLGFYRESLHPTTFHVAPLLDSVLDLLKSRIQSSCAIVENRCNPSLQITAMNRELRQVISNLVLNSLDSIYVDGKVVLRASISTNPIDRGPRIRITVADNGQGIADSILPQVFEAFFTTKGAIGNGLGLWVSKQIIDKHGGFIRVRTSTVGQRRGTSFSMVLPMNSA